MTITIGLDEFDTDETSTTPARTSGGRFPKGNKEGNRFPKGHSGKPKGAKNRKTLIAQEFAHDVLYLDPETGRQMTYHELCIWIKKKADTSPRILNLLLGSCPWQTPGAYTAGAGDIRYARNRNTDGAGC